MVYESQTVIYILYIYVPEKARFTFSIPDFLSLIPILILSKYQSAIIESNEQWTMTFLRNFNVSLDPVIAPFVLPWLHKKIFLLYVYSLLTCSIPWLPIPSCFLSASKLHKLSEFHFNSDNTHLYGCQVTSDEAGLSWPWSLATIVLRALTCTFILCRPHLCPQDMASQKKNQTQIM